MLTIFLLRKIILRYCPGGGYLVERWVRGCATENSSSFAPQGLQLPLIFWKSGFNIWSFFFYIHFCLFSLRIGCKKQNKTKNKTIQNKTKHNEQTNKNKQNKNKQKPNKQINKRNKQINGWFCTEVYWSEGKTGNLVWVWVANLVRLWFCY